MKKHGSVIIPHDIKPYPAEHEIKAAEILATQGKIVMFVKPRTAYKAKSFDVMIDGVDWEIKSPKGNAKFTIIRQLKRGRKQSRHIIIDTSRTKIDDILAEKQIRKSLLEHRSIKRVILITKTFQIIDICK